MRTKVCLLWSYITQTVSNLQNLSSFAYTGIAKLEKTHWNIERTHKKKGCIYINLHTVIRGWPKLVLATIEQETNRKTGKNLTGKKNNILKRKKQKKSQKKNILICFSETTSPSLPSCFVEYIFSSLFLMQKKKEKKGKNGLFYEVCVYFIYVKSLWFVSLFGLFLLPGWNGSFSVGNQMSSMVNSVIVRTRRPTPEKSRMRLLLAERKGN